MSKKKYTANSSQEQYYQELLSQYDISKENILNADKIQPTNLTTYQPEGEFLDVTITDEMEEKFDEFPTLPALMTSTPETEEKLDKSDFSFYDDVLVPADNIIRKLPINTAIKATEEVLKMIPFVASGIYYGVESILKEDADETLIFDNAVTRAIEGAADTMRSIAGTKIERKHNPNATIWQELGDTEFWATEGADAAGFFASMLVPGSAIKGLKIAAGATKIAKGIQKIGTPLSKYARLNKAGKIVSKMDPKKIGQFTEDATAVMFNTAFESGAEASGTYKVVLPEAEKELRKKNPELSEEGIKTLAKQEASKAASDVYKANMALLLLPNMVTHNALVKKAFPKENLIKKFYKGKVGKREVLGRALKGTGKGIASEAFLEEGGQFAIEDYYTSDVLGDKPSGLEAIPGIAKKYVEGLPTTEFQKSMVLGGILGGASTGIGSYRESTESKDQAKKLRKAANNLNLVGRNIDSSNLYEIEEKNGIRSVKLNGEFLEALGEDVGKKLALISLAQEAAMEGDTDALEDYMEIMAINEAIPFIQSEEALEVFKEEVIDTRLEALAQKKIKTEGLVPGKDDVAIDKIRKDIFSKKEDIVEQVEDLYQINKDVNESHEQTLGFDANENPTSETLSKEIKSKKITQAAKLKNAAKKIRKLQKENDELISDNDIDRTAVNGERIRIGDIIEYDSEVTKVDNKLLEKLNKEEEYNVLLPSPDVKRKLDKNLNSINYQKNKRDAISENYNDLYSPTKNKQELNKRIEKKKKQKRDKDYKEFLKKNKDFTDSEGNEYKIKTKNGKKVLYKKTKEPLFGNEFFNEKVSELNSENYDKVTEGLIPSEKPLVSKRVPEKKVSKERGKIIKDNFVKLIEENNTDDIKEYLNKLYLENIKGYDKLSDWVVTTNNSIPSNNKLELNEKTKPDVKFYEKDGKTYAVRKDDKGDLRYLPANEYIAGHNISKGRKVDVKMLEDAQELPSGAVFESIITNANLSSLLKGASERRIKALETLDSAKEKIDEVSEELKSSLKKYENILQPKAKSKLRSKIVSLKDVLNSLKEKRNDLEDLIDSLDEEIELIDARMQSALPIDKYEEIIQQEIDSTEESLSEFREEEKILNDKIKAIIRTIKKVLRATSPKIYREISKKLTIDNLDKFDKIISNFKEVDRKALKSYKDKLDKYREEFKEELSDLEELNKIKKLLEKEKANLKLINIFEVTGVSNTNTYTSSEGKGEHITTTPEAGIKVDEKNTVPKEERTVEDAFSGTAVKTDNSDGSLTGDKTMREFSRFTNNVIIPDHPDIELVAFNHIQLEELGRKNDVDDLRNQELSEEEINNVIFLIPMEGGKFFDQDGKLTEDVDKAVITKMPLATRKMPYGNNRFRKLTAEKAELLAKGKYKSEYEAYKNSKEDRKDASALQFFGHYENYKLEKHQEFLEDLRERVSKREKISFPVKGKSLGIPEVSEQQNKANEVLPKHGIKFENLEFGVSTESEATDLDGLLDTSAHIPLGHVWAYDKKKGQLLNLKPDKLKNVKVNNRPIEDLIINMFKYQVNQYIKEFNKAGKASISDAGVVYDENNKEVKINDTKIPLNIFIVLKKLVRYTGTNKDKDGNILNDNPETAFYFKGGKNGGTMVIGVTQGLEESAIPNEVPLIKNGEFNPNFESTLRGFLKDRYVNITSFISSKEEVLQIPVFDSNGNYKKIEEFNYQEFAFNNLLTTNLGLPSEVKVQNRKAFGGSEVVEDNILIRSKYLLFDKANLDNNNYIPDLKDDDTTAPAEPANENDGVYPEDTFTTVFNKKENSSEEGDNDPNPWGEKKQEENENLLERTVREKDIKKTTKEDIDKFESWLKQNLPGVSLEIATDLIGQGKYGYYKNLAITLDEAAEEGTGYHEAFHAVSQSFLTKEERDELYNEWKKKNKNKLLRTYNGKEKRGFEFTDKEIEEDLAESFRDYMLLKDKAPVESGIKKFFKKIWRVIKRLFLSNEDKIEELFDKINTGKFSTQIPYNRKTGVFNRILDNPDADTRRSSPAFEKMLMGVLDYQFFNRVKISHPEISIENIFNEENTKIREETYKKVKGGFGKVFNKIRQDFVDKKKTKENNIIDFRRGMDLKHIYENWDKYVKKHAIHVKSVYKSGKLTEDEIVDSLNVDEVKDLAYNSSDSAANTDVKQSVTNRVRMMLATLPAKKYVTKNGEQVVESELSELGIATSIPFENAYSIITEVVGSERNVKKIVDKLYEAQNKHAFLLPLFDSRRKSFPLREFRNGEMNLITPSQMSNLLEFFQAISKHRDSYTLTNLHTDGSMSTIDVSKQSKRNTIKREWESNALAKRNTKVYDENGNMKADFVMGAIGISKVKHNTFNYTKFFKELGIEFTYPDRVNKLYGGRLGTIVRYLVTAAKKNQNGTLVALVNRNADSGFGGNYNELVDMEYLTNPERLNHSVTGLESKQVYELMLHSFITKSIEYINTAESLEDLYNKAPWLNPKHNSYIGMDSNGKTSSVLLNQIFSGKNGKRDTDLSIEKFIDQGAREDKSKLSVEFKKMTPVERLRNALHAYSNNKFPIIRLADKSLEHLLGYPERKLLSFDTSNNRDKESYYDVFSNYLASEIARTISYNKSGIKWKNIDKNKDSGIILDIVEDYGSEELNSQVKNLLSDNLDKTDEESYYEAVIRNLNGYSDELYAAFSDYFSDVTNDLYDRLLDYNMLEVIDNKWTFKPAGKISYNKAKKDGKKVEGPNLPQLASVDVYEYKNTLYAKFGNNDYSTVEPFLANKGTPLFKANEELTRREVKRILTLYSMVDTMMNIEQTKLLFGDPIAYKNLETFFKRLGSFAGTVKNIFHDPILDKWMEDNMDRMDNSYHYEHRRIGDSVEKVRVSKTLVVKEVEVISNEKSLPDYNTSMEEGDGGGYASIDAIRDMMYRAGDWTDSMEDAYQWEWQNYFGIKNKKKFKEIYGRDWDGTVIHPKKGHVISKPTGKEVAFSPFKYLHVGALADKNNEGFGDKKSIYKYSLKPILPSEALVNSTVNKMLNFMLDNGVEQVMVESAAKGITTRLDNNNELPSLYNNEGEFDLSDVNDSNYQYIYLDNIGVQLDVWDKEKLSVIQGSQVMKQIFNGIVNKGVAPEWAESLVREYDELINSATRLAKEELLEDMSIEVSDEGYKITDFTKFRKILREASSNKVLNKNELLSMLDISEDTGILSTQNSSKLEQVLFKLHQNRVTQRSRFGGKYFQTPGTLYTRNKRDKDEDGNYTTNELAFYAASTTNKIETEEDLSKYAASFDGDTYYFLDHQVSKEDSKDKEIERLSKLGNIEFVENRSDLVGDINQDNIKIKRMEVLIPNPYKFDFKKYLNKYNEFDYDKIDAITDEELKDTIYKMIEAVGFRIPTQGPNSIESMVIKGFLPDTAANTIVLPSEIVRKAGSDYDIDSLNVFLPNIEYIKGKPKYIKYISSPNDLELEELRERYIRNSSEAKELIKAYRERVKEISNKIAENEKEFLEDYYVPTQGVEKVAEQIISLEKDFLVKRAELADLKEGLTKSLNTLEEVNSKSNELTAVVHTINAINKSNNRIFDKYVKRVNNLAKDANINKSLYSEKFKELRDNLQEDLDAIMPLEDFALLSIEKQNGLKAIENRMTEVMHEFLTSIENFSNVTSPLDDPFLSKELAPEIYEKIHGRKKNDAGRLYKLTQRAYLVDTGKRFAESKGAVGIIALNSTFQDLAQRYNFYLDNITNKLNFKDKEGNSLYNKVEGSDDIALGGLFDANNERNLPVLFSLWMSAAVDAVKDTYMFDMGVTLKSLNTVMYLTMAGVPTKEIIYFINQPVIRRYFDNQDKYESKFAEATGLKKFKNQIIAETLDIEVSNFDRKDTILKKIEAKTGVKNFGENVLDFDITLDKLNKQISNPTLGIQAKILNEFLRYQESAKTINEAIQNITYDTKHPNSFGSSKSKLDATDKFIDPNTSPVKNLHKVFEEENDGFLAAYKAEMKKWSEQVSELNPLMNQPNFVNLLSLIADEYRVGNKINEKDMSQIYSKLVTNLIDYLVITNGYTFDRTKTDGTKYKSGEPMYKEMNEFFTGNKDTGEKPIVDRLREAKNKYKYNKFLQNLQFNDFNRQDQKPASVYLKSNLKMDYTQENEMIHGWQLLLDGSPKDEKLALDLAKFVVMQNGFSDSPINIAKFMPYELIKSLKKPVIDRIKREPLTKEEIAEFLVTFAYDNFSSPLIGKDDRKHKKGFITYHRKIKAEFKSEDKKNFARKRGINIYDKPTVGIMGKKLPQVPFLEIDYNKGISLKAATISNFIKKGNEEAIKTISEELSIAEKLDTANKMKDDEVTQQGINISSNSKGIGGALTNPTELAKRKGNLSQSYPIEFNGNKYKDVEAAYQSLKDKSEAKAKPSRENSNNYKLMVDLITVKLNVYPRLVTEITKQGGSEWILSSTHQPTQQNTVWETDGQNWFILALNDAYNNVTKSPQQQPIITNFEAKYASSGAKKAGFDKKDIKKFNNKINKLISRGSNKSSSAGYAKEFKEKGWPVNVQTYSSNDVVGISAEGNRKGRVKPNLDLITKAANANVTFITDPTATDYNIGEKEVHSHLASLGYTNNKGVWTKAEASNKKKLFNPKDKSLKKGSVVEYKGKKYLFWNNNNGKAQLIKPDGTKFSGTPNIDKLNVLGSYATTMYNNTEYIVTDNNNVYSGATGKLVYTGKDNSSKTQKKNIIDSVKSIQGQTITDINDMYNNLENEHRKC